MLSSIFTAIVVWFSAFSANADQNLDTLLYECELTDSAAELSYFSLDIYGDSNALDMNPLYGKSTWTFSGDFQMGEQASQSFSGMTGTTSNSDEDFNTISVSIPAPWYGLKPVSIHFELNRRSGEATIKELEYWKGYTRFLGPAQKLSANLSCKSFANHQLQARRQ